MTLKLLKSFLDVAYTAITIVLTVLVLLLLPESDGQGFLELFSLHNAALHVSRLCASCLQKPTQ